MEQVDITDLKSVGFGRAGSSPAVGTKLIMIKLIVATGLDGEIGKDGELPWEDDFRYHDDNVYFQKYEFV